MPTSTIHRPLLDWPDYYAGIDGTIVSGKTGRTLSTYLNEKGYPRVRLWRDGKVHHVFLHKLITAAFLGERPPGLETLHADDNKANNALVNLSYGTQMQNWEDRRRNGRTGWGERDSRERGHPYDEANTRIRRGTNTRLCRTCHRDDERDRQRRRRGLSVR